MATTLSAHAVAVLLPLTVTIAVACPFLLPLLLPCSLTIVLTVAVALLLALLLPLLFASCGVCPVAGGEEQSGSNQRGDVDGFHGHVCFGFACVRLGASCMKSMIAT